jgi:hypothetical protein
MRRQLQRRFQEFRCVVIITYQGPKHAHFLFDERTLFPVRKHRIQIDDLGRLVYPRCHLLNGIAQPQMHALHDCADFRVQTSAPNTVSQQGANQCLAFN